MSASSDDPRFSQDLAKYLSADPNALPIPQRGSLGDINRGVLKTQPAVDAAYDKLRQQEDLASLQKQRINEQIGLGESLSSEALARGQTSAIQERKKAEDAANKYIDQVRANFPHEEFHPTKDNTQTLAGLFSLIGVIGMSMGGQGRLSAIGAKNAMSGMMNGWQTGNINRWNQEKAEYDRHMANIKNIVDDAYKDAQRMMQTASTNYQEAVAMAQQTAAKLGSQVARWKAANGSVEDFFKYVEGVKKDVDKADNQLFEEKKEKNRQDFEMGQQGRLFKHQLEMKNKEEGTIGYSATLNSVLEGETDPHGRPLHVKDEKIAKNIFDNAQSISRVENLRNRLRDPDVRIGFASKLAKVNELLSSLSSDGSREISEQEVKQAINDQFKGLNPTDKNVVFQKDALFTAYDSERALNNGRLLVSIVRQATPVLDPTNYRKPGYDAVLAGRESLLNDNLISMVPEKVVPKIIKKFTESRNSTMGTQETQQTSKKFSVKDPKGITHEFDTEAQANKFRELIKLASETGG